LSAAVEAVSPIRLAAYEAEAVRHRYGLDRGLDPVSFAVTAPGVAAVTGPNGSGKSTLLRILAGLLRPSGGRATLRVAGAVVAPAGRRRHVGYASPELAFYDEMSVAENLGFAAEALGLDHPAGAVRDAIERVGLQDRAGDRAAALSSGLRQRLRLAFALLHRPAVLLLDEPGSHLDDEGRALVAGIVAEYRSSALVLIATNDEREWRLAEQRIELRGRGLGHSA
jgi:heme exporter protein A